MNYTAILIGMSLALATPSCKDQGKPIEFPTRPESYHHGGLVSGVIVASFVDTISLAEAQTFVCNFGLTPLNFINYETDPLHSGTIGVPDGQEQFWIDSLVNYPKFIRSANRLAWTATS